MGEAAEELPGDIDGGLRRGRIVDGRQIRYRQRRGVAPADRQRHPVAAVLEGGPRRLLQRIPGVLYRDRGEERQIQDGLRTVEEIPRRRAPMVPGGGATVRQLHAVGQEELSWRHLRPACFETRPAAPGAPQRLWH